MRVLWQPLAIGDVARLHAFLERASPRAAQAAREALKAASRTLSAQPRLGAPLTEFSLCEVRHLIVGDDEMRYEVRMETLHILRIRHCREDR